MATTERTRRLLAAAAAVGALAAGGVGLFAGPAGAQEDGDDPVEEAVEYIHEAEEDGLISSVTAECAILALENDDDERCQASPSPIMPELKEVVWGGGAFFVLLAILWKFGLPAATRMMDERTARIQGDLDRADTAKTEAEGVLAEYQRQLADARSEATRVVDEARQQAEQVRRDLVARAEAEAAELRTRNAEQLVGERERVLSELRGQVGELAIELAERVVESSLDREANQALIERYIDSVGRVN